MSEGKKVNFYDLTVRDLLIMNKTLRDSILDRIKNVSVEEERVRDHPDLIHSQTIDGRFLEIIGPMDSGG